MGYDSRITPDVMKRGARFAVCSGKSKAEVTNSRNCARRIVLFKLTTDRHEASRGLSATAELLVCPTAHNRPGCSSECLPENF